jgi:hypothetical protein
VSSPGFRLAKGRCCAAHHWTVKTLPHLFVGGLFWLGLIEAAPVHAVLFYSTADPNYNTTAPAGALADSGWALQGLWGVFLGTPVAPRYFLTARHIGGTVGDPFLFQGASYVTTAFFDDFTSDLRLWQVDAPFPAYAQVYSRSDEVGHRLVVFGRGTQRGTDVVVTAPGGTRLRGWRWGAADLRLRWGENQVDSITDGDALMGHPGQSTVGDLLKALFDADAGANEAHLSNGDSAGAVFLHDGTAWKLAGINFAADGLYSLSRSGPGFNAALFDQGGLYTTEGTNWVFTPFSPVPRPGAFYATRISAHGAWIQSVISRPIVEGPVALQSSPAPAGIYCEEPQAQVDAVAGTVTIPIPTEARFYRLSASAPTTISRVTVRNSNLVLSFSLSSSR